MVPQESHREQILEFPVWNLEVKAVPGGASLVLFEKIFSSLTRLYSPLKKGPRLYFCGPVAF